MACPTIITGDEFLSRVLTHIDCQAQLIGSYGYQTLGEPGSLAATLMTGLLTLFIALFGLRLMFGPAPGGRDLVYDVLKIGIVLTLAFSWPAFRTLVYDVTLKGPAEIASAITPGSENAGNMVERLQRADNKMVEFTSLGTGRNTGEIIDNDAPGNSFEGAALQDESTLGIARLTYLAGTIGTLALLRIAGGLLLALAPLVVGLLLFTQSRGIAAGWLKGLVLVLAGSVGATLVLSVELALLEPWLSDALRVRALGYATPSAPIELFAITLAFLIVQLGMVWIIARIAFYRGWLSLPSLGALRPHWNGAQQGPRLASAQTNIAPHRAERFSHTIETSVRREQLGGSYDRRTPGSAGSVMREDTGVIMQEPPRLGSSYRRNAQRHSQARTKRDRAT